MRHYIFHQDVPWFDASFLESRDHSRKKASEGVTVYIQVSYLDGRIPSSTVPPTQMKTTFFNRLVQRFFPSVQEFVSFKEAEQANIRAVGSKLFD